ncbi:LptA/OstA family protein [Sphingomonas sp.]|uniref:LptA/OstA family protein n=1 Tax=Sphingomonas sp. TaxID=28214 RepID=UPI001B1F7DA2|nr:LptA/OstA family protein [Sphingomonas sp.]MBO9714222.1 LptA/OstA family protein [Sphingomonas sp.]
MHRLAILPLGLLLGLSASGPVAAQSAHNSDAPIDFGSDHIELLDRDNRVLLTGNVKIVQAEMTLTADRVTVSYTGNLQQGSPDVSRLDAAGGVTVVRPEQSARSQYAVYDLNKRVITMIGGVTLRQGANVVNGGRLSINLDSGRATIDGSGVGSGVPGTTTSSGGRVTGRFSVPKRNTAAPSPSPTPPPQQ